jgi:predicted Fe-Mo cluster-binding NifX family protein
MIIAVTSMGDSLEDQMAYRLARSAYYLIIDTESMDVEPIENMDRVLDREVSDENLRLMRDRGVRLVVTGHCGPEAHELFGGVGIGVLPGVSGSVVEAVERCRDQELPGEAVPVASEPGSRQRAGGGTQAVRGGARQAVQLDYETYVSMKAEMVVMQRKLLELHRRVARLEKRHD